MNRRKMLLGGLSGSVGVFAGCSGIFSRNQPEAHKPRLEVYVANDLDESVRVTITALRGSTEFFSHTYTLGPGKGDESESFVGSPTAVKVAIENGRTETQEFSVPPTCESPDLNITIKPGEILVTNGCVTS